MSDCVQPHRRQPTRLPVPGILQARTLEWVAVSFSNTWKWKVKVKSLSHVRLLVNPWTAAYQALPYMGFSKQEYWSRMPLPSPTSTWTHYKLLKQASYLTTPERSINIFINTECFRYINWMSAFENNLPLFQVPKNQWHLKNLLYNLIIIGIGPLAL